jgi:hypothetical protein
MYKFILNHKDEVVGAKRLSDMAGIPFDMGNRDCVQFLQDWKDGATVTSPDGSAAIYSEEAVAALGLDPH